MELKEKLDAMGTAFEEFKKTNDLKLEEVKKFGTATAATETKLAKIEGDMDKLQKSIDGLNAALARTGGQSELTEEAVEAKASKAYRSAVGSYMRKGVNIPSDVVHPQFKDMSVDVESDGGFLVSPEIATEITKKLYETSPMRQLASVMTIGTDMLEMLYDGDEADSGWVGETQARPVTNTPGLKQIKIPVNEIYANPRATQKLLDDAAINIEAWLAEKVRDRFERQENRAFWVGDGILKPKGVFAYDSGTGFNQIERVNTALNSAMGADDFINLQTALKEGYQGNATWVINRLLVGTIRKYKDTVTGQYIWQPGLQVGSPDVLLGRPVVKATDLPNAFAASTDLVAYGDFKAGYQIVDRFGIRVLRDPYTMKPWVTFYTTKRVGGGVKDFEAIKILRSIA